MELNSLTRQYAEMVVEKFLNLYENYDIQKYFISDNDMAVVFADTVAFYIKYDVNCDFMTIEENRKWYLSEGVCGVDIEELTPNTLLPNYKHGPFMREIQEEIGAYTTFVRYARFKGTNAKYLSNGIFSHADYVMANCPEIKLKERLDAWEGIPYTIVIFELKSADGKISFAADAIKGKVHPFVLKIANNLAYNAYGNKRLDGIGLSEFNRFVDEDFVDSLFSHKGQRMLHRLQNNLLYYSLPAQYFRDEIDVYNAVRDSVQKAKLGKFASIEKIQYSKPEYKWKTEEYVLKIIKKHYRDYGVVSQHRPFFLRSSFGGQMSYDVFISKLKIAVEYQGKQHFEPVEFFGGEEAYEKVKMRDEEKRKLSELNGIKLVYFNYWDEITPELICERIDEACTLNPLSKDIQ